MCTLALPTSEAPPARERGRCRELIHPMLRFPRYLLLLACLLLPTALVPPQPAYSNGEPDELVERGNGGCSIPPWLAGDGQHRRGMPDDPVAPLNGKSTDGVGGRDLAPNGELREPLSIWEILRAWLAGWWLSV